MITSKQEQVIDEILGNFDFSKVHKAMEALNWEWALTDGVPNQGALRRDACSRLEAVADKDNGIKLSASGGFVARRHEKGGLSLAFEIDSWDAFPREDGKGV